VQQQPEKKVDGSVKERFKAFRGGNVSQKEEKIEGEEVDRRKIRYDEFEG
jgi:hypothetical protein